MEKEQIDAEEKALRYIARAADGSMRDALSLLDQCIAFYLGQTLTYENVLEVLGTADTSVFSTLLRSILKKDSMSALDIIDTMIAHNLAPKRIQFVYPKANREANMLLIEAIKDGSRDGLKILPPLFIHNEDGSYTPEIHEIYYGN